MVTDRDYYWLSGCMLLLAVCAGVLARKTARLETDMDFLLDHALTRETEARPNG